MNKSGFEPLDLRVLVKPDDATKKTAGGIILPDEVVEKDGWAQAKGTLVAIGENAWEEACARGPHFKRPNPGDRILFGKYAGHTIEGVDGEKYRIMNDEDVVARLEA